jgi:DNA replication ATP-dependent helicase Dna2
MEAASKSSLVSALLENATSSFQDHSPDERMDQSPSLNKRRVSSAARSSPLQDKGQDIPDTDATVSDYGDDDFDDESFMQLEAQIGTSQPNPSARSSKQDAPDTLEIKPSRPEHPIAIETLDDSDETIDELMENNKRTPLAHKNAPVTPAHGGNRPIQAQVLLDLDDEFDEFDDDLDLEAVEMVMTQSMKQASHSNLSVCWQENSR